MSKKKGKLKGEVGSIDRYRAIESYDVPCRESKESIKKRMKIQKEKLESLAEILDTIDIGYEEKQRAIGSAYLEYFMTKRYLKNY